MFELFSRFSSAFVLLTTSSLAADEGPDGVDVSDEVDEVDEADDAGLYDGRPEYEQSRAWLMLLTLLAIDQG